MMDEMKRILDALLEGQQFLTAKVVAMDSRLSHVEEKVEELKGDIESVRAELKTEIARTAEEVKAELKTELKAEIARTAEEVKAELKTELKAEIARTAEEVKAELKAEIARTAEEVKAELKTELKAEIARTAEEVKTELKSDIADLKHLMGERFEEVEGSIEVLIMESHTQKREIRNLKRIVRFSKRRPAALKAK